jgi:hypothetical protein
MESLDDTVRDTVGSFAGLSIRRRASGMHGSEIREKGVVVYA